MKIIHCASVFSDHCVLQRNKPIRIWGTADTETPVQVTLNGHLATCVATEHNWTAELPSMEAGGPYTLEISSEGEVYQRFNDIMIGEVWLAGGQSNMEYTLAQDGDGKTAMEQAPHTNVRFFQVPRLSYQDDYYYLAQQKNHWMLPTDEQLKDWSAVGYYFAAELAEKLGITIGIIGCNWGGTSACAWQDKESLLSHKDTRVYWDEYEELLQSQTSESYEKERADYLAWHKDWQPRMDAFYAAHPTATWEEAQETVGICRWPGPMGPKHEFRPCGLYETMLQRVIPYTLAGFIYYQGESDDHRPYSYYHLFKNMIGVWRRDFKDEKLPFLCVQLPVHHYLSDTILDKWCPIRQAQMQLHKEGIVTGIAVTLDCGEYNNIHPIHKKKVGKRLAFQALHHVYHIMSEDMAYGPVLRKHEVTNHTVTLYFDYAKEGFLQTARTPVGFELADETGKFIPCRAEIQGETILLTGPQNFTPVQARYFWTDYDEVTLFGKNKIPVAPFHTGLAY